MFRILGRFVWYVWRFTNCGCTWRSSFSLFGLWTHYPKYRCRLCWYDVYSHPISIYFLQLNSVNLKIILYLILNFKLLLKYEKSENPNFMYFFFFTVAVMILFFICWTPYHAQRLMAIYLKSPSDSDLLIFRHLTNASGVLYYLSATINPILYSLLSLKFRRAFRDTFSRQFWKLTYSWILRTWNKCLEKNG